MMDAEMACLFKCQEPVQDMSQMHSWIFPKKRKRKRRKSQPASANVLRCRRATCYLTRAAAQVSTTVSVHQYSVNKLNDLFIIIIIIIVSFITMLEKKCDSSYSVLYFQ